MSLTASESTLDRGGEDEFLGRCGCQEIRVREESDGHR